PAEHAALRIDEPRLDVLQRDPRELAHPRRGARERNERGHGLDDRQAELGEPSVAVAGRPRARVALAARAHDEATTAHRLAVRGPHLPPARAVARSVERADPLDRGVATELDARSARLALERVAHLERAAALREDLLERFLDRLDAERRETL